MDVQLNTGTTLGATGHYGLEPFLLPAHVRISGGIAVEGDLLIEGHVEGAVRCHILRVGKDAHIDGRVIAENIVVEGAVSGEVYARTVELGRTCHVEAAIFHASMTLEEGAYFEGQSRKDADPIALAQRLGHEF